ncbi:unnamed protein product, partial [marine sediment metagenome]
KKHTSLDVVASKIVFLGTKPQEKAGEAVPVGEEAGGEEDIPV